MTKLNFAFTSTIATAFLAASVAGAADWPHYRGPNLDGSTSETIATKWPAGGPKALWKVPAIDGFSSLTVSGGQAFTLVMREVDGGPQEVCVALDANTGKEQWMAPLGPLKLGDGGQAGAKGNDGGDGPRSTPTVSDGKVYVMSAKLVLSCFDAKSGKVVWHKDLVKDFAGRNISWQNAASPLVEGSLVYVAGGGAGQSILAFNKQTGAVAWKAHDEKITHSTPVAATIHGVRQLIFFCQSGLVSVDAKDGMLLWKRPFKFAVSTAMTPIVAGDLVFCSAGYGVGGGAARITKAADGWKAEETWFIAGNGKDESVANHWSTPVYKDGHLYGMFQFKEYGSGALKCVELATGKVKWSKPGFGPGNLILLGNQVLALSDAGELVVADATPAAYKEVSRAKVVSGKCWSTPVVSNGRVYVRSTKEAACLDVAAKAAQK